MKNNLLVISNHDPKNWDREQKEGWDNIDYIPFPNINPEFSASEVWEIAKKLVKEIKIWLNQNTGGKINLQGEFSLSFAVFVLMSNEASNVFTFPTTERVVEEKDGKKISVFKFVMWRNM